MGITLELAAHPEATLDRLDDDTTDAQMASVLFEESEHMLTIGRIWHVIHYLLTESVERTKTDESFLLWGGRHVGPSQPNGRARVLGVKKCARVAAVLVDEATFRERLATWKIPSDVIYSSHVKRGAPEPDYVRIYASLRAFVRGAVDRREGIVLAIIG